jgi:hypothetical protein
MLVIVGILDEVTILIPLLQHMFLQQIFKRKIIQLFHVFDKIFFLQIRDVDNSLFMLFSHSFLYLHRKRIFQRIFHTCTPDAPRHNHPSYVCRSVWNCSWRSWRMVLGLNQLPPALLDPFPGLVDPLYGHHEPASLICSELQRHTQGSITR